MEAVQITALAGFFVTSILIELTPGPNMAYLALLGVQRGRVAGLFAVAGVALGLAIVGLLAAFGLAALIGRYPLLYEVIRWAGVAYLVWLGWDSWREAKRPLDTTDLAARNRVYFRRGLITNLLNPKAAVFYLAVLPNFLAPGTGAGGFLTLAAVYVLAATLVHAAIVLAAGALQPLFVQPRYRERLGAVFGILLVVVALWLAISTAR